MLSGCTIYSPKKVSCCRPAARHRGRIIYIHRRGAFGVARFDRLGNARALMRGTSDRYSSHAFFVVNLLEGDEGEAECIIMLIGQKDSVYLNYLDEHPHFYAKEQWIDKQYTVNDDISEYAATFYILRYDKKYIGVVESSRPNTATYLYSLPDRKKQIGLYAYVYEQHLADPLISRDMNDFYREIVKKGNQWLRDKQKWEKEDPDYLMCVDYEQEEGYFLYNPRTPIKYRTYFIDEVPHVPFKDWSNRLENVISTYLKDGTKKLNWLDDGIDLNLFSNVYDRMLYVLLKSSKDVDEVGMIDYRKWNIAIPQPQNKSRNIVLNVNEVDKDGAYIPENLFGKTVKEIAFLYHYHPYKLLQILQDRHRLRIEGVNHPMTPEEISLCRRTLEELHHINNKSYE